MNSFKASKFLSYYDKVGIDHDNIKKNKLSQWLFNAYYFFFHEKRNSLSYKTNHLILGSNIILDLILAYKLAYLEIYNDKNNKPKSISIFFSKKMDFWNYNLPSTPLFKKQLQKKIEFFNLNHENILTEPKIKNLPESQFFKYIQNDDNVKGLDNKKMILTILKDFNELNKINNNIFIKFIDISHHQVYNIFNVSEVCKKEGSQNNNHAYNNILRLAHINEVKKLDYPNEYEYLKENLKRVKSYDYLYEDLINGLTQYPKLSCNLDKKSTVCPDYNILTYYLLVENIYITSSTDLHPWANLKIKTVYFGKNEDFLQNNNTHHIYQDKTFIHEVINTYFEKNDLSLMNFDYSVQVFKNSDKPNYHFLGSSHKIANSANSFMAQPLLDLDFIFK